MTKRELATQHEEWIADQYSGRRSRSSGASDVDKGDVHVKSSQTMFECKLTGEPGGDSKRTTLLKHMEKIADEAWAEGKEPAIALRLFSPESTLADVNGWVDLTVRLANDDASREAVIHWASV